MDLWIHSRDFDRPDLWQTVEFTSMKLVSEAQSSRGTEVAANRSNRNQVILSMAISVELDSYLTMDHSYRIVPDLTTMEALI